MGETNISFEDGIKRLEQIVRGLERGDVPLEESLKLFQEGTELVARCEALLNEAELQIKKIVPGANGEPIEEDFDDEP